MKNKNVFYVGVIKSDKQFKVWAFGGCYDTEQQAVDAVGDNIMGFVNTIPMNEEIEFEWETDSSKLGYYSARSPELIGSLTKRLKKAETE